MKFRLGPPIQNQKPREINKVPPAESDLFTQLLPCSWRGLIIPISTIQVSFSQDLVEHKYWNEDGARVEATGANPLEIEAEIPFFNHIVPGKNEKFVVLYPTLFRQFIPLFEDKTVGVLVHPELGELNCRPHSLSYSHDGKIRDGVLVKAKWIQTNVDTPNQVPPKRSDPSDFYIARDLDASRTELTSRIPNLPQNEETYESLVRKATATVDQVTTTSTVIANKPQQLLYRLKQLEESVERAKDALLWPVLENSARLKERTYQAQEEPPPRSSRIRRVRRYVTTDWMTVADIVAMFPTNTVDDILQLNSFKLQTLSIRPETPILYYAE